MLDRERLRNTLVVETWRHLIMKQKYWKPCNIQPAILKRWYFFTLVTFEFLLSRVHVTQQCLGRDRLRAQAQDDFFIDNEVRGTAMSFVTNIHSLWFQEKTQPRFVGNLFRLPNSSWDRTIYIMFIPSKAEERASSDEELKWTWKWVLEHKQASSRNQIGEIRPPSKYLLVDSSEHVVKFYPLE